MSWLFIYGIVEWSTRLIMVPVILRRRFQPATSLAWLTLIFFIPIAGLAAYLLFGAHRLGLRRVRRYQNTINTMRVAQQASYQTDLTVRPDVDPALRPVILQAERITGMPILGGNEVDLVSDTDDMIDRLVRDIDAAERHVHLLFYIFRPDQTGLRVADALIRAAARGVRCRLLADAVGSRHLFSRRGLGKRLNEHHVTTVAMLPAAPIRRRLARVDLRNHRKLAVIDGKTAYTGSQNIVNAGYGHKRAGRWIDLSGRFEGPLVGQLQAVFVEDWMFDTNEMLDDESIFPNLLPVGGVPAQAVPTGPSEDSVALQRVILAAINAAQRKIIITSPYLVPDEATTVALYMAVDRGVEVTITIPYRCDHPLVSAAGRAYIEPLLAAGVRVFRFHPGMLHAKTMTVDDAFSLLGSSNLDIRSFFLNFELNVLLYGSQITRELRFAQTGYLADATPISLDDWRQRPTLARYAESAAALLSPLL